METDVSNATIVQSTVDLGHNLGLEVVAEGVEDMHVYNKLAELGCDYAQGYFLSRPITADKLTVWLEVFGGFGEAVEAARDRRDEETLEEWQLTPPQAAEPGHSPHLSLVLDEAIAEAESEIQSGREPA